MLGPLEGLEVLDLFAGSGALGLEAVSRGAAALQLVDGDEQALRALRRNLETLGVSACVHRGDALAFLAGAGRRGRRWDLVLLDPPYSCAGRLGAPLAAHLPPVLNDRAMIVTESDKRAPLELPFALVRQRDYGDTRIAIHRAR